jgi:hypothetical protein
MKKFQNLSSPKDKKKENGTKNKDQNQQTLLGNQAIKNKLAQLTENGEVVDSFEGTSVICIPELPSIALGATAFALSASDSQVDEDVIVAAKPILDLTTLKHEKSHLQNNESGADTCQGVNKEVFRTTNKAEYTLMLGKAGLDDCIARIGLISTIAMDGDGNQWIEDFQNSTTSFLYKAGHKITIGCFEGKNDELLPSLTINMILEGAALSGKDTSSDTIGLKAGDISVGSTDTSETNWTASGMASSTIILRGPDVVSDGHIDHVAIPGEAHAGWFGLWQETVYSTSDGLDTLLKGPMG